MFTDFLYLLRSYGMKTSLNEWNSLMDALEMNLNDAKPDGVLLYGGGQFWN